MTSEREQLETRLKEHEKAKRAAKGTDDAQFVAASQEIVSTIRQIRALPEDNKLTDFQISSYCWALYAIASKSHDAEQVRMSLVKLVRSFALAMNARSFWGDASSAEFGRTLFNSLVQLLYKSVKSMNDTTAVAFAKKIAVDYLNILDARCEAYLDAGAFHKDLVTEEQRKGMELRNGGKRIRLKFWPSLAEKAYGLMNRCLKADSQVVATDRLVTHLHRNVSKGDWLGLYCVTAMIRGGHAERARSMMKDIVRAKHNEAWAWTYLADTYRDKPEMVAACHCKALTLPSHDPEISLGMAVKSRRVLADALQRLGLVQEAQRELALAERKAPVDSHDGFYVTWAGKTNQLLLPSTAKRFTGRLIKREDKSFGFVKDRTLGDVFIPPKFVKCLKNGDQIAGWADLQEDKNKKRKSLCMISALCYCIRCRREPS